jgi:hypothetical protein
VSKADLFRKLGAAALAACLSTSSVKAGVVIDDFAWSEIVNTTVNGARALPTPGVFPASGGGSRAILLIKADESSETSISIGSGVLTWTQTAATGDYGWVTCYGDVTQDLSAYNALRVTVNSAPANPGLLGASVGTYVTTGQGFVSLPSSGTVDIPFSLFDQFTASHGYAAINYSRVWSAGLIFYSLSPGVYEFSGFEAVLIPEPSTFALAGLGSIALMLARRRD